MTKNHSSKKIKTKRKYQTPPRGYDVYGNRVYHRHGYVNGLLSVIEVTVF